MARSAVFRELLQLHFAPALDKQLRLADQAANRDWRYDVDAGLLTLGDETVYQAQILGTESHVTQSWLWAWANAASSLPAERTVAANWLRDFGAGCHAPELTEATLPLADVDGHALAAVASGLCASRGYFRAPYVDGAAFLLLEDEEIAPADPSEAMARILHVFPQALASGWLDDHALALAAYAEHYGLSVDYEPQALHVHAERGVDLHATFDDRQRLLKLQAVLNGSDRGEA